jgi:hypothetical protein
MLYKLNQKDKSNITPVQNTTFAEIGWTEKDLEEVLSKNLIAFLPDNQLFVIFQERQFQEEADIFALDKQGKLFIFELKRWESSQENIPQVLRYGQKFGRYDYYALEEMFRGYSNDNAVSLQESHFKHFQDQLDNHIDFDAFNSKQHFVIVTNGVDRETIEAIQYWKDQGLNIDCLPYKLYKIANDNYFEFSSYNPENDVIYEGNRNIYFVNTNWSWDQKAFLDMLNNSKASAYGGRRYSIGRIKPNDIVLLYHTRCGVIACGKAIGDVIRNEQAEEYYVKLKFEWMVNPDTDWDKAVHAWEINLKLGTSYSFRGTVISCDEETYAAIRDIQKTK